jgi:transglutaminase-like putative cysteine protease
MQLKISHTTRYSYDQPVDYALQKVRLRPQHSTIQDIVDWSIEVEGGKVETSYTDHYGNHVDLISITPGSQAVSITASGTVTTQDVAGVLGKVYGRAPLWHFQQPTLATTPGAGVTALATSLAGGRDTLTGLHALSAAILLATPYQVGVTNADTTVEEALHAGAGVCQDHAQIFVAACRTALIPARYVSGYLMINGQVDQDATHAWAEAHVDGLGWVGFDVSNGVAPDDKYVRIAVGRDARDAAPIEGLRMGAADEAMIVSLQVQQ